ncbi:site-specific integrase [Photobacterium rosenbergii]|uniref:Site-specific integrase n=1 Tax=Photobacterium rosenbergii TaxID=294936 RepID=A0ABU3ZLK2_9GAMM|nr:site-specific integrase [Photobacterium rosenbergii]MDV5170990.1 site-specific integrase [Photobacterium rosenbergii]
MNKRFKFTNATLKALPANSADSRSTELEVSDTEIVGLKCLSGRTGSKRFLLRYTLHGKKRSIAIGRFPDIDVDTARRIARKHKAQVADGIDPKQVRDESADVPTVKDFFYSTYLPMAKKRKKTWDDDEQRFRDHAKPIADIAYNALTAHQVMQLQLSLSDQGYSAATNNRVLAMLKTVGKLAERLLNVPNVALMVSLLPENNTRTRFCDLDETRRIIKCAREYHCPSAGNFIALLFLMGCRESELRYRKWTDVDLVKRTLSIPNTKNGSSHTIFLSDLMVEIFQSIPRVSSNPHVFPGTKKGKPIAPPRWAFNLIKKRAGIKDAGEVLFHTARHSVASNLISNGADISAVKVLLNHRSVESTLIYAKHSEANQRQTTAALSDMIEGKHHFNHIDG